MIGLISKKITPILMTYAEKKSKTLANSLITQAVTNEILTDLDKEKLFVEKKDNNNNIISTDFDSVMVNKILNEISSYVETYLEELETGKVKKLKLSRNLKETYGLKNSKNGIVYEIPSGIIFGNALLSNLGPKIPVRINLNGDVVTNIKTEVTDYGINNALIKVSVTVKVYMNVIIPFNTKEVIVESDIPIVMRLIKGEVPNYYYPVGK
jgi:sporulation protein YunB